MSPPATSVAKVWWFVWILCTVILPGTALGLSQLLPASGQAYAVCIATGLVILILHLVASSKLGKGSSVWMSIGLVWGGLFLMGVSFFIGCVAMITQSR